MRFFLPSDSIYPICFVGCFLARHINMNECFSKNDGDMVSFTYQIMNCVVSDEIGM